MLWRLVVEVGMVQTNHDSEAASDLELLSSRPCHTGAVQ
jgi:hypothetical protein